MSVTTILLLVVLSVVADLLWQMAKVVWPILNWSLGHLVIYDQALGGWLPYGWNLQKHSHSVGEPSSSTANENQVTLFK